MARSLGLRARLQEKWDEMSGLVQHSQQQPIRFEPRVARGLHTPTRCFKTGFCVCRRAPDCNRRALQFVDRAIGFLKKACWSKGSGKERAMSPARRLLEKSHIFLAIRRPDAAADDKGVWLHVGFVNYKTWAMGTLEMACVKMGDDGKRAYLQLLDVAAEDLPFILEQLEDEEDNENSTLSELASGVRTLPEAVLAKLDLEHPQEMSLWKFADKCSEGTSLWEQMLACFAQVVRVDDVAQTCVWKGSDDEEKPRQNRQRSGV